MESAIQVNQLSKTYQIYGNPYNRLLERLPWVKGVRHQEVRALRDITFTVAPGQCVGMVGSNGAGKSTLLKILTGTTFPTSGSFAIRGRVASLLELGAGFHQSFTGRENIYMNAAMMGFSHREAKKKIGEIIEFSELGEFINAPIRTYSSGMVCRLGFSVAVATEPDVLIIDEILAVGDMNFRRKCVEKIWEYKNAGKTLFFCSHSLYDVRQICDSAIWLRKGGVEMNGDSVAVTNEYATYEAKMSEGRDVAKWENAEQAEVDEDHPRILAADLVDPATGEPRNTVGPGDPVGVRIHVRNSNPPIGLALAVGFMRTDGTLCFAHSTEMEEIEIDFEAGFVTLIIDGIRLLSGEFTVPVWLLDGNGVHRFHERPASANLIVQNRTSDLGLFLQDHRWRVEPGTRADLRVDRVR